MEGLSEVILQCEICRKLTEHFLKNNLDRKGSALCEKCMDRAGITPVSLPYEPPVANKYTLKSSVTYEYEN